MLIGLDEPSVRSVNGVRVAQHLLDTFDGDASRIDGFRLTLRAVKEWARVNGLYSNVLGFLGGVNWAMLVCWVCRKHPDAPASRLLPIFFRTFAKWGWPRPVRIESQSSNSNGGDGTTSHPPKGVEPMRVWDPSNHRDSMHLMPIITPCYPQMNSSYNVGEAQLRRMRHEFRRASEVCDGILSGRAGWDSLFEESDFFDQHANYLQVSS